MDDVFIVVEGIGDSTFLKQLIDSRLESYSGAIKFIEAGTNGRSIKKVKIEEIRTKTSSLEFKTIFILDADAPNYQETLDSLIENFDAEGLKLSRENIFLLPNDSEDGCLENLLLSIVSDRAEPIFHCFESYKECIHQIDENYTKPDLKTKIYAYSEIVTKVGNEKDRDYSDSQVWNLQHEALTPLIDFLKTHLS